uniref:Uncharacterized protein n=1 Tax=Chromera velia CCMP2878 TaxID=1169474 RepID=A0A0G4I965_9ALVE|eukprot:Cvel_12183.t1-p1 / transcript=Cvel_12183.t1 / gene=Cvel_12183 / organism=Chromera_velia_CCMP2878 / gene_product=hypothetical protein / transcript_product=hypothetical protein / location=Cvel_scaffold787:5382-7397(+) / protein_length=641 / sequence_SO=supercontig / SO=protein_coding / is_pseudo=false
MPLLYMNLTLQVLFPLPEPTTKHLRWLEKTVWKLAQECIPSSFSVAASTITIFVVTRMNPEWGRPVSWLNLREKLATEKKYLEERDWPLVEKHFLVTCAFHNGFDPKKHVKKTAPHWFAVQPESLKLHLEEEISGHECHVRMAEQIESLWTDRRFRLRLDFNLTHALYLNSELGLTSPGISDLKALIISRTDLREYAGGLRGKREKEKEIQRAANSSIAPIFSSSPSGSSAGSSSASVPCKVPTDPADEVALLKTIRDLVRKLWIEFESLEQDSLCPATAVEDTLEQTHSSTLTQACRGGGADSGSSSNSHRGSSVIPHSEHSHPSCSSYPTAVRIQTTKERGQTKGDGVNGFSASLSLSLASPTNSKKCMETEREKGAGAFPSLSPKASSSASTSGRSAAGNANEKTNRLRVLDSVSNSTSRPVSASVSARGGVREREREREGGQEEDNGGSVDSAGSRCLANGSASSSAQVSACTAAACREAAAAVKKNSRSSRTSQQGPTATPGSVSIVSSPTAALGGGSRANGARKSSRGPANTAEGGGEGEKEPELEKPGTTPAPSSSSVTNKRKKGKSRRGVMDGEKEKEKSPRDRDKDRERRKGKGERIHDESGEEQESRDRDEDRLPEPSVGGEYFSIMDELE